MTSNEVIGLDELMARAWPGGLSDADELALAGLSTVKRERLTRRLLALLRWTEPLPGEAKLANATDAAALAGLGLSRFYALLAEWKKSRTLACLGVHAADSLRRNSSLDPAVRKRVVTRVQAMIESEPGLGLGKIRSRLLAEGGDLPSSASLVRIIEDARRLAPPGLFGCDLIFDSAGLDLLDPEGYGVRLYVVIDGGTGIVLGAILGTARMMSLGILRAAEIAHSNMTLLDLSRLGACQEGPGIDIRFDPDDADGRSVIERHIPLKVPPVRTSEQLYGRAVIRHLGNRLGRVWLGVGKRELGHSYRTGRRENLPYLTAPIAASIEDAIEKHNATRLSQADGPDVTDSGILQAAFERVRSRLVELTDLEPTILALPSYSLPDD